MVEESQGAVRQAGSGSVGMRARKNAGPTERGNGSQGKSRETSGPGCLVRGAANDTKLYPAPKAQGRRRKLIRSWGTHGHPFRT